MSASAAAAAAAAGGGGGAAARLADERGGDERRSDERLADERLADDERPLPRGAAGVHLRSAAAAAAAAAAASSSSPADGAGAGGGGADAHAQLLPFTEVVPSTKFTLAGALSAAARGAAGAPRAAARGAAAFARSLLPWARGYGRRQAAGDAVAGAVVATLLVPQAMSYALLTGALPANGIYASIAPLYGYALLTTVSALAVGIVAPMAVLSNSLGHELAPGAAEGSPAFVRVETQLAFAGGAVLAAMAALRMEWVTDFLSYPVQLGFTYGSACLIVASQVADLFGIRYSPPERTFGPRLVRAAQYAGAANGASAALGAVSLLVLLYAKDVVVRGRRLPRLFPTPLLVLVASIAASYALDLERAAGVKVVGRIPSALPAPSLPFDGGADFVRVLPSGALVGVIAYVQTLSIGATFSRRAGEEMSPARELLATAAANLLSGAFSGTPVAGSFSRTAVAHDAGAATPAAGAVVATLMIVAVLTLTPALAFLPVPCLAAVVTASVRSLLQPAEALALLRASPTDFFQMAVTLVAILWLDVQNGLFVGMGVSLAFVVYHAFRPRLVELARLPGTDVFVAADRFPQAQRAPGVRVLRLDGEISYGNVRRVAARLRAELAAAGGSAGAAADAEAAAAAVAAAAAAASAASAAATAAAAAAAAATAAGARAPAASTAAATASAPAAAGAVAPSLPAPGGGGGGAGRRTVWALASAAGSGSRASGASVEAAAPSLAPAGAAWPDGGALRSRRRADDAAAQGGVGWGGGAGGGGGGADATDVQLTVGDRSSDGGGGSREGGSRDSRRGGGEGGGEGGGGAAGAGPPHARVGAGGAEEDPWRVLLLRASVGVGGGDGVSLPQPPAAGAGVSPPPPAPPPAPATAPAPPPAPAPAPPPAPPPARAASHPPLRAVVLDCSRVTHVDATGCRELLELSAAYERARVRLVFAALPGPVRDTLARFGVGPRDGEAEPPAAAAAAAAAPAAAPAAADGAAGGAPWPPRGLTTRALSVAAAVRALEEEAGAEEAEAAAAEAAAEAADAA